MFPTAIVFWSRWANVCWAALWLMLGALAACEGGDSRPLGAQPLPQDRQEAVALPLGGGQGEILPATASASGALLALAVDVQVLYVVPNGAAPPSTDQALAAWLLSQGMIPEFVSAPASATDWQGKDLVLVSSFLNSSLHASLRDAPVPIVTWENFGFDEMGFATGQGFETGTEIAITDPSHPLAAGFSGTVAVYDRPLLVRWATPVAGASVVASLPAQPELATIIGIAPGTPLTSGVAPAARVGLFMDDRGFDSFTQAGESLLSAAIQWALDAGGSGEPGPNQPPTVSAGPDQTAPLGSVISLVPAIMDDGSFSVQWSGAGLDFEQPNQANTVVSAGSAGSYEATLQVDDGEFVVTDQVILTFTVPPPTPGDGGPYDLMLVVNSTSSPNASDRAVIAWLEQAGHAVTLAGPGTVANAAQGMDAVLISSSVNSSAVSSTWADAALPVLTWEAFYWNRLGLIAGSPVIVADDAFGRIVNSAHPLSAGLSGLRRLAANGSTQLVGTPGENAIVISELQDGSAANYFAYDVGATMPGGVAPARRVALHLGLDLSATLTADGKDLFEAALAWAVFDTRQPRTRIQLLGDSITRGTGGFSGYREPLAATLDAAGCSYDFVGTEQAAASNQLPSVLFDWDHEGHGGFTTGGILTELSDYLEGNSPAISLVHLGSNDLLQNVDPLVARDNLRDIIEVLRTDNPNVVILLAQIINSSRGPIVASIAAYNAAVAELAVSADTPSSPVVLVDQFTGYNDALFNFDGLHPNPAGEAFMAERWAAALDLFLRCSL